MPLPLTISCSSKSRLVLTFLVLPLWYLLTQVVPDIFQKSSKTVVCVCVCVCVVFETWFLLVQNGQAPACILSVACISGPAFISGFTVDHLQLHHNMTWPMKLARSSVDKVDKGMSLCGMFRCTRAGCDVTFKTFALFSNHMCRAHDLVPYTLIKCIQCERCFRTEKSHEWHVKHMHGEERLCDKCDFVASSKAMLKWVFTML